MLHPSEIARELKSYPFFNSFGESLILLIATMAKASQFGPGEDLLKQGQANNVLYFLRAGKLNVIVSGETVARLEVPGEVIGEMSVLSRKPASATVQADGIVQVYAIDVLDFDLVAPKDRDRFQYLLYKIYCEVLSERLRTTNEKAKAFEATNRNLEKIVEERTRDVRISHAELEQQHATLQAAFRKLTDIADMKDRALKLINEVYAETHDPRLGELVKLYELEKSIEKKKVLFVDPDKKQNIIAKLSLGGSGVSLDVCNSSEEAKNLLAQTVYDLLICDLQLSAVTQWAHQHQRALQFVNLASQGISSALPTLKQMDFVGNFLTRSADDKQLVIKSILTAATKILNNDVFGIEKYLTWGVEIKSEKITTSSERTMAIERMKDHLKLIGVRSSFLDRAAIIAEEMLMNAIYDAPAENGKSLFNHLSRSEEVKLNESQAAVLRYACDGNMVAISVTDPFGGLKPEIIFKYLESCYSGQAGVYNQNKGGAGRGLHQIVENSDVTVVNVKKSKKTEFISLLNLEQKEKQNLEPSLNCFFS